MTTKDVYLVVFDERDNYSHPNTQSRLGFDPDGNNTSFKKVVLVTDRRGFDDFLNSIQLDDQFVLVCHVFHAAEGMPNKGFQNFLNSKIEEDYSIDANLVSTGTSSKVTKSILEQFNEKRLVYLYNEIIKAVSQNKIRPYSKSQLSLIVEPREEIRRALPMDNDRQEVDLDYGIITALFEDEFEQVKNLELIDWKGDSNTETIPFRRGEIKTIDGHVRKVVLAVQPSTGMVDAATIASIMLERFKPKFLLMPGVCGGKENLGFGDIVIASKVLAFQKGKISDKLDFEGKRIKVYDQDQKEITGLFTLNKERVNYSIENFEVEHDSIPKLDNLLKDKIQNSKEEIEHLINKELKPHGKEVRIVLDAIACSTMVVNKSDYFNTVIKPNDKRIVAVEMESYGIARACELANGGKTKFVIMKSVMDHMAGKDDTFKTFAAHTSARYLYHLLLNDILFD